MYTLQLWLLIKSSLLYNYYRNNLYKMFVIEIFTIKGWSKLSHQTITNVFYCNFNKFLIKDENMHFYMVHMTNISRLK